MPGVLTPRDWGSVERDFLSDPEYNYAVVDDLLPVDVLEDFRLRFLQHWGWRQKEWISRNLHNWQPDLPHFGDIGRALQSALPHVLGGLDLVEYWGLMYPTNTYGRLHVDLGGVAVSIWLTADEYNMDPSTGGLVIYRTKRPADWYVSEGLIDDAAEAYLSQHDPEEFRKIPYRCNRMVLFDGTHFHKTDTMRFAEVGPESYRINAALSFDDRDAFERRKQEWLAVAGKSADPGIRERDR